MSELSESERLELLAVGLRAALRDAVDAGTDAILAAGMPWRGHQWSADKVHFDDYRDSCQQIQLGLVAEVLIHGIGPDAYVTLDASSVGEFFVLGRAFKINTLTDGYKLKDLGGTLSTGQEVKALKAMDYYELVYWRDPRLP